MTINTKYSIGDEVYFLMNNKVLSGKITNLGIAVEANQATSRSEKRSDVNIDIEYVIASDKKHCVSEDRLFLTKDALLRSL